jgi:hypothetical protein
MRTGSGLVGRDNELEQFAAWRRDVASGTGHAVLLEGEPGIGKSSLARAAVLTAEEQGFVSYWAECDVLGQALPLQPLLDALLAKRMTEPRLDTIQRLLRGELANEAAGNPLYLTELMDALHRSDRLEVTDSGAIDVTDGPVSHSLVAAIADRLDSLQGRPARSSGSSASWC